TLSSWNCKNYKRQKLGEGVEWDSDKVALLESVNKNLGDRWADDFGKSDASDTEKPIQEMRKEEYQRNTESLKKKEEAIAIGLWKVLSDNGLSHKVLISVLYSFIDSGDKSLHPGPKLESCIMAANIYIILIKVPGSGAYNIFHPLLFQKALDVLRLWPCRVEKKRKRRNEATAGGRKAKARRGKASKYSYAHGDPFNIATDLNVAKDAVKLLQSYSLKDSEQVLEHVIQLFVETTRLEVLPLAEMTFDFPGVLIVFVLNFMAMLEPTLEQYVFKHLISNFLMISVSSSVTSNGLVMRDVQTIKDQAIQFVNHITRKDNKDMISGVKVLVQVICTKCPERAEYRSVVAKISYRIFALDLISLLLLRPEKSCPMEDYGTNENIKTLLSKTYLLDIVIARCSDRAPMVRAKALQYFAQCLTSEDSSLVVNIKAHLNEAIEKATDGTPTLTQTSGQQNESKGISAIIRQRTCDDKVGVRKAALEALESIIRLSLDSLQKADVLTLHDRCMDPALSVRKQAMISLTALLQEKPSCTMVQSLWLDGVFPLVMDRETTAQEKCFQILDEVLLSSIAPQSKHYLHFAFQHWAKQNRLSGNLIKSLVSQIDTGHSKAAWLCLAEIGSSSDKLDHSLVVKSWNDYSQGVRDCDSETLCRILSVLGSSAPLLPHSVVRTLTGDLHSKLISFECPPDVIASITATLCKLGKVHPLERGNSDQWCSDLLKASEEFLSQVMLTQDFVNEELLTRHLFTVGEVAQLAPSKTTERLFMFVESLLMSHNNKEDPRQKLNLSPPVKAHAFVTLGKLCLQNEDLAKQCIAALARELETSNDPAIRNNVIVVMCDLCVRYTSLVDRYIPNIAACLKDSAPLVRRQTLTLLTHLLQEDFVKWKGALFYRFITTLVDEDPEIWKFADFCLVHLLLSRHPGMLYQHFVECVFHFNSYEKHKGIAHFHSKFKRLHIYQFMLSHMGDEDKFNLTGKLCQEVVKKNMIENIIPIIIELKHLLEKQHSPLLRDLMSCLKEVMKDYRTEVQDVLSADRQLANEIEFDLKRFEEEQKELEDQRRKQLTPGNSTQVSARSSQASGSTPAVQPEVFVTPQLRGVTPPPKNGSNVTPLAGAINKMQIGRRHTLAADGQTMVPITNALTSKVRVMISPLQDKRRHTFVAPAIMRSARKAIDHAQKVTEQLRRSSSVPQVEVAEEDINAVTKGQQIRTPLKPVNPKVSQKQNEDRAASTPAGNVL
ncbi:Condensin-2 complex subunit D3, partial [Acropora cervicornis]